MTRRACAMALAAIVGVASSVGRAEQFRLSTSGVRLDVLVLDGAKPLAGLTTDHFDVRGNGVPQHVDSVAVADAAHVMVVLDVSGSVQGEPLRRLTTAANGLLARLTARDRLTLVGFGHHMRLVAPANGAVPPELLPTGGMTSLHDAIFGSLLLAGDDPNPALMILLTDGLDSASWLTHEQVLVMAARADVVVYPVVDDYDRFRQSASPSVRRAKRNLERLADETGGRVFPLRARQAPDDAFLGILEEYRHRYIVTYSPPGLERRGWHRIDVRLKGVRGTVHTRRGYEVP